MTTAIESVITEEQAEFARSRGWKLGTDCGFRATDLWVSESGCVTVYPSRKFDEIECWVAALFYNGNSNAPHTTRTYKLFKEAIAANS